MFSTSIRLQVSIWSSEFHGILKFPNIIGSEFSCNEVIPANSSKNVCICTGFFFEKGGL